MFDIITVGSNTIDAFVKTKVDLVNNHSKRNKKNSKSDWCLAYPVGEKILINHLEFQVGGGGTNTAVAFSRFGLNTGYLGKIGNDENGVIVFRMLKKEKIKFIGALGELTGYSVILDSIQEDRTILTHKGCNDDLKFNEINLDLLKTKWFYFSSMIGESLETQKKLAEFALENNIRVAFNPSSYLARLGMKNISQIMNATNIIICNKEEASMLTGKKKIRDILKEMKKHVKDVAVVTDAKNGAWAYNGKTAIHGMPRKNLKIVETTGAGDGFASGFVTGNIKKKDLKTCMRMGFIEAESVIEAYGAKNHLVTSKEMTKMLKKDRRQIKNFLL